jgi:hypothetical protein
MNLPFYFWVMIIAPAILGVFAIFLGLKLLRKSSKPYADNDVRRLFGIFCLIVALGIGACYGHLALEYLRS